MSTERELFLTVILLVLILDCVSFGLGFTMPAGVLIITSLAMVILLYQLLVGVIDI